MTEQDFERIYRQYLSTINADRLDEMHHFVANEANFNGLKVNPQQYGEYIASIRDRCERGIHFELLDLVIDAANGRLASKLVVTGKPSTEVFGVQPTGREMRFNEAAFYTWRDGKIVQVFSIIDRGDVADSLAGR